MGLVGLMPLGALYPSKSGLMNKHIVKHIVKHSRRPTVSSNTSEGQVRQAVCLWFGLVWFGGLFLMRCLI